MKIKPKPVLTVAILYLGLIGAYSAFGYSAYQASQEDNIISDCNNYSFYSDAYMRVFSHHWAIVKNNSGYDQTFTFRYSLCLDNGDCTQREVTKVVSSGQPMDFRVKDIVVVLPDKYKIPGDYTFTSTSELFGYKNFYTIKTCKIKILK